MLNPRRGRAVPSRERRLRMTLNRLTLRLIPLFGLAFGLAAPAARAQSESVPQDTKDIRRDGTDSRADKRDLRKDERDRNHDRRDVHRDQRDLNHDRRDLRNDERTYGKDSQQVKAE